MKVPISQITIKRERYSRSMGDMEELATSIARFGLLQPILLDDNYELIAGFRRLTAHQMNGEVEIEAMLRSQVDDVMAKELEIEENIQRQDLTWQERASAISQLDALRKARDPNWSQRKTAIATGTSQNRVSEAVTIANAMALFPELAKAKDMAQATRWMKEKVQQVARISEVKDSTVDYSDIESKIILGDSTEVIKTIPSESFHAIITDPPFGVDYGERVEGTIGSLNSYEDGKELYLRILGMAPEMYRVLKPNGWLTFFFGMSWYREVVDAFTSAGFTVDPIPVIWDRSGGRTFTNRPDRYYTKGYDVALHAFKGDAKIVKRSLSNVVRIDPVANADRELVVERPVELYEEFIERLTLPGETVADFFVGSGSCPAACAKIRRNYFGVEQNAERRAFAIQKIKAYTPDK